MTSIRDGELADLLPSGMRTAHMACLSHAIRQEAGRILSCLAGAMYGTNLDGASEQALDALACEWDAPYYAQDLPVERKREIVRRALPWHRTAGTPAAVVEMAEAVFGGGSVREWFVSEGGAGLPPYCFDLETEARLTPDVFERVLAAIDRVKNARSHLIGVRVERHIGGGIDAAAVAASIPQITVTNAPSGAASLSGGIAAAALAASEPRIAATNAPQQEASAGAAARLAGGIRLAPEFPAGIRNREGGE